jgi:putative transposase
MKISRTGYYYQPKKQNDDALIKKALTDLSVRYHRWGFKKMFDYLRNAGHGWNHKRVYRVYGELSLNLRVKPKKRLPSREKKALSHPVAANVCWSMDFMSDVLTNHQRFRTLNVLDDYNRESLLIKPAFSLSATIVTRALDELADTRGYPAMVRVDNGPEFIAQVFKNWATKNHVFIHYIQPGKPAQNGIIERFNRTYREDILDAYCFDRLADVQRLTQQWQFEYNHHRPHEAIKSLSPVAFAQYRNKLNSTEALP